MFAKREGDITKLNALSEWSESTLFDEHERTVLEYIDAITYSDRYVTDILMDKLRLYFDDDGIVELTALIAFQNMSSKFNSALDVPSQGFCRMPSKEN
jgi:alkylhydroperoxidase family enzyme